MKKREFKSESKRLLDLMINSVYTNKEIFLRELISNGSDALDKLYYRSLTDKKIKVKKDELTIEILPNEQERTLTISDNGCGMTKEELETNLGTIAKSGSLAFKELTSNDKNAKKVDVIGQFGVGFYSAFMVSDKIEVTSKSVDEEISNTWISEGADGYTIEEDKTPKKEVGTTIKLYLKKDNDDENYSKYLEEFTIKNLIKKYSDYVRYPIKLEVTTKEKDQEPKTELETINSMIPLWKKDPKTTKEEEYERFYTDRFYDYEKPSKIMHINAEGTCTYKALLFIPSHTPFDFYTKEYEKGLSLYSNGILIMETCKDLLPDYFSFVKGIVDSEDLSLNISREMLQKSKNLNTIAKSIETKIKKELESMLKDNLEDYKKFFKTFGIQLKFGVYNNYGMDKDKLQDLLMFYSSKTKDLITLKDYISNMKDTQDKIYYATGETIDKIDLIPQLEQVKGKDYEVLYLTENIDEFTITALREYEGKSFVNVCKEDLDLEDEASKTHIKKINEDNKDLLNDMKNELKQVNEVRFTSKLKEHPVCLTTKGEISIEMEKVINAMPTDQKINAETILEINENHPITKKLQDLHQNNKEEFVKYTKILYAEARLIEGLTLDNPTEISTLICDVIAK